MKHTDRQRQHPPAAAIHHHDPAELHNEGVLHERSDINVRAISLFIASLATIGMVVHLLMWGLFVVFERQAAANDPPISPLARGGTEMPRTTTGSPTFGAAAKPQLLTNEPRALDMQRQSESQTLTGYGWVDEKRGVTRIPIDEAKKLILERGLPTRGRPVSEALGTALPSRGESSSGRAVIGLPRGAGLPAVAGEPQARPPAQQTAPPHKPGGGP